MLMQTKTIETDNSDTATIYVYVNEGIRKVHEIQCL